MYLNKIIKWMIYSIVFIIGSGAIWSVVYSIIISIKRKATNENKNDVGRRF